MMDSEKIEKQLHELRDHIYIDQDLKKRLRESFRKRRIHLVRKISWMSALVTAVVFFALFISNFQIDHTRASSLNIMNSISFFDVGEGEILAFSHSNGSLYVSLKDKGMYKNSDGHFEKISDAHADSISQSSNKETLLFTQHGNIYVLNLLTNKKELIMKGSYSKPEWKDLQTIYAIKGTGKQQSIVEINLITLKEHKITTGTNPSYITKEQKLVFERDGDILIRDSKTGNEKKVDSGKEPSVSKNGVYISYIKEDEGIENVWICDLDLETKKKATTNFPSLENPNKGLYDYSSPVWNSNGESLYVLKKRDKQDESKVMKISFSEDEISPRSTVERYLQALIVRDDDYAKSLMMNPPEFLTYSNPSQAGFQILSKEEAANSAKIIAEVYWTYNANPYYKISTYEFELLKEKDRFIIEKVTELDSKEILDIDNSNEIVMLTGDNKTKLFSMQDIPTAFIQGGNIRISSLLMDHKGENIIFSLQEMAEIPEKSSVTILEYNLQSQAFKKLLLINSETSEQEIVISKLSIDSTGQFIAAYIFSGEQSEVIIFDLNSGKQIKQFKNTYSVFWEEEKLILRYVEESTSLLYKFHPKNQQKMIY